MERIERMLVEVKRRNYGFIALVCYIAAVVAANILTAHLGLVPMGFGLVATAGTYSIGGAYLCRDFVQRWLGREWIWGAMFAGAALSYWLSTPGLAVASGVTFLCAETMAYVVFAPLQRRGLLRAVFLANAVGVVADTLIFLWLAGFPLTLQVIEGQLLGKWYVTVAVMALRITWKARVAVLREPVRA